VDGKEAMADDAKAAAVGGGVLVLYCRIERRFKKRPFPRDAAKEGESSRCGREKESAAYPRSLTTR